MLVNQIIMENSAKLFVWRTRHVLEMEFVMSTVELVIVMEIGYLQPVVLLVVQGIKTVVHVFKTLEYPMPVFGVRL